jgi:hypothetical protein
MNVSSMITFNEPSMIFMKASIMFFNHAFRTWSFENTFIHQFTSPSLVAVHMLAYQKRKSSVASKRAAGGRLSKTGALDEEEVTRIAHSQRDQGLQMCHVLGKVLYNKRDGCQSDDGDEDRDTEGYNSRSSQRGGTGKKGLSKADQASAAASVQIQHHLRRANETEWMVSLRELSKSVTVAPQHRRPSMRYDPENLLLRSGLDALGASLFLHENYPPFFSDDSMDQAAVAAEYLSDALTLLATGTVQGEAQCASKAIDIPLT